MTAPARKIHGGSSPFISRSPDPRQDVNAPTPAKSGRLIRHDFSPDRGIGPDYLGEAAEVIRLAFPGPSENAVCERAAMALGVAPNTIRNILRGETKDPSWRLLRAAMAYIPDPFEVPAIRRFVVGVMRG